MTILLLRHIVIRQLFIVHTFGDQNFKLPNKWWAIESQMTLWRFFYILGGRVGVDAPTLLWTPLWWAKKSRTARFFMYFIVCKIIVCTSVTYLILRQTIVFRNMYDYFVCVENCIPHTILTVQVNFTVYGAKNEHFFQIKSPFFFGQSKNKKFFFY